MNAENEVQVALDKERRAFARRQAAFFTLLPSQFLPVHILPATQEAAENEVLAADADWKVADAEHRRIVDESL